MTFTPPITKATHITNAKAIATKQGATAEQTARIVQDAIDYWQSRINESPVTGEVGSGP